MQQSPNVIIVGAGAAGLATAIFTARNESAGPVTLLDGAPKIGAKILVSGGGRCNVTNTNVTTDDFYGGNKNIIRNILKRFDHSDARKFFTRLGVPLHEETHGKLFPDTNKAQSVLDALVSEAKRLNVTIHPSHRVTEITRDQNGFNLSVTTNDKTETWHAIRLVLATGGKSLPKTGSDGLGLQLAQSLGHTIIETTPALDPLILAGDFHSELTGITHDITLNIQTAGEKQIRITGPVVWTHFGLSGPAAMNASRFWHRAKIEDRDIRMTANFTIHQTFDQLDETLQSTTTDRPKARVTTIVHQWLPQRMADAICNSVNIPNDLEMGNLTRDARRKLTHALTDWPVEIIGTRGYKYAEVTAGGIPLSEIDPKTMGSRKCRGLFLVGEILNADARIGGFNFQWAWSTAHVAGQSLGYRRQ